MRAGSTVVGEYYDAAVSGADPVDKRAGFAEMLQHLAANGATTIIVESPDRFARDLAVQLAGHDMLKDRAFDHSRVRPRLFHGGNADRRSGAASARSHRSIRKGKRCCEA